MKTQIILLALVLATASLCQETGLEPIVIPLNQYDDDGNIIIPKTEEQLRVEYKECNSKVASGAVSCVMAEPCCYF